MKDKLDRNLFSVSRRICRVAILRQTSTIVVTTWQHLTISLSDNRQVQRHSDSLASELPNHIAPNASLKPMSTTQGTIKVLLHITPARIRGKGEVEEWKSNTITFVSQDISPLLIYMNMPSHPIPPHPDPLQAHPSTKLSSLPRLFTEDDKDMWKEKKRKKKKKETTRKKRLKQSRFTHPVRLARYDMLCYVKGKERKE